jgi:hypothetical protein
VDEFLFAAGGFFTVGSGKQYGQGIGFFGGRAGLGHIEPGANQRRLWFSPHFGLYLLNAKFNK